MDASECCIFRAIAAALVGATAGTVALWDHGPLLALGVSPLIGSASASVAVALFWVVSLVMPCQVSKSAPRSLIEAGEP